MEMATEIFVNVQTLSTLFIFDASYKMCKHSLHILCHIIINMLPDIWGRDMWNSIHRIAYDYPDNPTEEDKEHYRQYYLSLQYVLPCAKCRLNYRKHLAEVPLTDEVLANRHNLLEWTINIHNRVNQSLGKPILSYKEAMEKIVDLCQPHKSNRMLYLLLVVLAVIMLVLIYYFWRKKALCG